jgi:glycine betaine catabolism A
MGDLARGAQQQAAQREKRQGEKSGGKNGLLHGRDYIRINGVRSTIRRISENDPGPSGNVDLTPFMKRQPLDRLEGGLPASWYYDAGHYRRELEAFWYGRWIAAAREEEIPAPGDWRVVRVGTQSIVVLRDASGGIRAFHNTCRHRGSILCTEGKGRFARERIVCPYHAWTYDLSGALVATPRRMPTPDFDMKDFPLYEVAAECWGGFVFLNLEKNPPPFKKGIEDIGNRFSRHRFGDLRIGKRIVADVKANWKLLAENFSECFHCPPVHPELCRVVTAYQDAGAWGLRNEPETSPEYKASAATLTLDGSARLPAFENLNEEDKKAIYIPYMLPPNLFLNVQPDYVNSHIMFPTGPESVRIVYDWLFEPRHLPLAEADLQHYVALWEVTNAQDARNCEWQQQGIQSREFAHGHFVPQEFDCLRFTEWVREELEKPLIPRGAPAARAAPSPTSRSRKARRTGTARRG